VSGYVYFIFAMVDEDLMHVKIGYTAGSPTARMASLQCGSPLKLRLAGWFRGTPELERRFHETFRSLRLHGEWFKAVGKLEDFTHTLIYFGYDQRITEPAEVEVCIHDYVCATCAPHPSIDDNWYASTADASLWAEFVD
jgi:hypothetical protein